MSPLAYDFPKWRMVYTDFAGNPYGEVLDAHDRQFNFNLLSPNTVSFSPKLSASMMPYFLTNKEGLILLYRNGNLAMTSELSSIQVSGDENDHALTVTSTETMHPRLTKRLVGKSSAGLNGPTTPTDQGAWLIDQLDALNAVNKTGLRGGQITTSGTISGGTWRYKPLMELMQELAATTNGFDFYQRPRDPRAANTRGITGAIDIAPVIGRTKPGVVFGFGTVPDNARSYEWLIDDAQIINRGFVLPPSFPDSAGLKTAVADNAASQTTRGLREVVISSDLSDYTLRQQLLALHMSIRATPREQFIIQPAEADGTNRVHEFLEDYNVGDMIRGRVQDQGLLLLDAMVRVYGVQVSLSDEGKETVDLTLINDGAATS